jgi:IS605 OrfB family transposase
LHQTTTGLVRHFAVLGIEDLHVRGVLANRRLARKIADIGFHEFRRQLGYKAMRYGAELVTASRWFPSSKIVLRVRSDRRRTTVVQASGSGAASAARSMTGRLTRQRICAAMR